MMMTKRLGDERVIHEPSCDAVSVKVNKCAGRCLSFSFPSSDAVLAKNPDQIFTVRAQCCRMMEIKMVLFCLSSYILLAIT